MFDLTIAIFMSNVTYCRVAGMKAVRNIDRYCFARKEVPDILLDKLGRADVLEFCIQSGPAFRGRFSRRKDASQDKVVSDGLWDLHL